MGWVKDERWFDSRQGQDFFLYCIKTAVWPTTASDPMDIEGLITGDSVTEE
jgi:hypothetical protein